MRLTSPPWEVGVIPNGAAVSNDHINTYDALDLSVGDKLVSTDAGDLLVLNPNNTLKIENDNKNDKTKTSETLDYSSPNKPGVGDNPNFRYTQRTGYGQGPNPKDRRGGNNAKPKPDAFPSNRQGFGHSPVVNPDSYYDRYGSKSLRNRLYNFLEHFEDPWFTPTVTLNKPISHSQPEAVPDKYAYPPFLI